MSTYQFNPFEDDGFEPEVVARPARCHDRMCGALDCINCHPENFDAANIYRGE